MSRHNYYRLHGHVAVPCQSVVEWSVWYQEADRKVAVDLVDEFRVSTVFLGLDHNWSDDGDPILFETMVFDQDNDAVYQTRACTWTEAEQQHAAAVAMMHDRVRVAEIFAKAALSRR